MIATILALTLLGGGFDATKGKLPDTASCIPLEDGEVYCGEDEDPQAVDTQCTGTTVEDRMCGA